MERSFPLSVILVLLLTIIPSTAQAFDDDQELTLVGAAVPDECFVAIGDAGDILEDGTCSDGSIPKTNQAYVWSLARSGSKLWFGTGANVNCLVGGTFLGSTNPNLVSGSYVCEYGESEFLSSLETPLSPALGDWRPPKIYVFDSNGTSAPIEISADFTGAAQSLLSTTVGLRAAGSLGSIVYLAGPAIIGGVNIFAFNSSTQNLIAAANLPTYSNIRNFKVHNGALYAGVANSGSGGGSLIRFLGDPSNPLNYQSVLTGNWGEIAEFDFINDYLYFGTWPNLVVNPPVEAAVYRIELSALEGSESSEVQIWTASDYEPDPVIALTYGVGALSSFDGQIYWGTMHVPYTGFRAKLAAYAAPGSPQEIAQDFLGTLRAGTLYRTSVPAEGEVDLPELLYGNPLIPVCNPDPVTDPPTVPPTCSWTVQPNEFSLPRFGLAGFGNPFNNYIWSMAELEQELYVGTMDWSYLIVPNLPGSPDISDFQVSSLVGAFLGQIASTIDAIRLELASESPDLQSILPPLITLRDLLNNAVNILPDESPLELSVQAAANNLTGIITDIENYLDPTVTPNPDPEAFQLLISRLNSALDAVELLLTPLDSFLDAIALQFPDLEYGADLFRFTTDTDQSAEDISVDGLGNQLNYGIRTMVADSDWLYLGTANPMNLSVDGGWELYKLGVAEQLPEVQPTPGPEVFASMVTPLLQVNPVVLSGYPGDLIRVPVENFLGVDVTLASVLLSSLGGPTNQFSFEVPNQQPGMHKLRFYQSSTGRTFEFDFEIKQRPVVSTSKLNVGSFNGYVAIYAKGHKGSTLSWKIAGKWFRTTVTKDFQVFQRRTAAAGKQVQVELYVNGVKPAALSVRLTTK